MSKTRVAIVYGFCEGPRLGRKLVRALNKAGFEVVADARHADVLIAHSAGCWILPKETQATMALLVGVSLQPLRSLLPRFGPKVWHDFLSFKREGRAGAWLRKTFWNGAYFWRMDRNGEMLRAHAAQSPLNLPTSVVVVQNRNDAFASPRAVDAAALTSAALVGLPGEHDDIWEHPEAYVRLLRTRL